MEWSQKQKDDVRQLLSMYGQLKTRGVSINYVLHRLNIACGLEGRKIPENALVMYARYNLVANNVDMPPDRIEGNFFSEDLFEI